MTEEAKKNTLPCISNYAKVYKDFPECATISMKLLYKKEGNSPFLEGYVRVLEADDEVVTVDVFGYFTALNENNEPKESDESKEKSVVWLEAKEEDQADLIGDAAAWPFNANKEGEPQFETLSFKIGEKTHYAHVFTRDLPEDVIALMGIRERSNEESAEQAAEQDETPETVPGM